MTANQSLSPCPFCGNAADAEHAGDCYFTVQQELVLSACADPSRVLAARVAWNRRPTPPKAQAGAGICSKCQGSGEQQFMTQHLGPNDYEVTGQCSECGGTGAPQNRQASAEGAPAPTHAELLALGADCADTLLAIGRRIGFGRAQQILGEQWDAEFGCAPRGSMGVTVKDVEALRVAVDHIDMAALEISHCKDAAIIREALVGIGRPPKKRGYMGSTVEGGFDDHDEAALAAPKPLDDPRLQQLFGDAIEGALAFGFQGNNAPPAGHWLQRFWDIGRAEATKAAPKAVAQGWISVEERMPVAGKPVIAFFRNSQGLGRTVRAHYSPLHTVDASQWDEGEPDETEDGCYEPEGWWEDPVIGERLEFISPHSDGEITHWMPLPSSPAEEKKADATTQGARHG